MAILFKMPNESHINEKKPIPLLIAPPGSRYIPSISETQESLMRKGWTEQLVGISNTVVHNAGYGIRAKRTQYGLRHHIGSTIHSVMGQTISSLVTRIGKHRTSPYSLWMPSQVVVLLSRTRKAKDTIFVTDNPTEVANSLYNLLLKQSPFRDYLSYMLDQLCSGQQTTNIQSMLEINMHHSIFRPSDATIPTDNTGHVYIIMSTKDPSFIYIGSTKNLYIRFSQHNSGVAALQTAPASLRPWALLAYVSGFEGNSSDYVQFENEWIQAKLNYMRSDRHHKSIEGIVLLAKDIIASWNSSLQYKLVMVNCGTFDRMRERQNQ
jgi:predicted GIY-YIG superfamily endonuclease